MKHTEKHPSIPHGKTAVLIVNLGTPNALGYWPLRRYLKEFLSDPRVVEKNRVVWWCVLNIILLSFIPFRSSRNYAKIWNTEKNESPLRTITRETAQNLRAAISKDHGENIVVEWAMRYGTPSIEEKILQLKEQGCDKLIILPLYPQYSAVTTGSVCDAVFDALKKIRWMPTLRIIPPYYDHPAYIEAVQQDIQQKMAEGDTLVLSYHGLPKANLTKGDPYNCHCYKTSRLLAEKMDLPKEKVMTTFQSRFGREEWLKPYTDKTLEKLPTEGITNITIATPGFSADCVETLEEIALQNKETFIENGGKSYQVVPCLNSSENGVHLYKKLIEENLF